MRPSLLVALAAVALACVTQVPAGADEPPAFYTNDVVAAPSTSARTVATPRIAATYPIANTFKLHSRPASTRTIYLDFNGYAVTENTWSSSMLGMSVKTYAGFNLEGSALTYTEGEHNFIQQTWRRVAELYSPFDVDVTTEEPTPEAIARAGVDDLEYGVIAAVTSDATAPTGACGSGSKCSGIAPIGTFDDVETSPGYNQPAWAFASNTYPDVRYPNSSLLTAATITHEVGHTLGLRHDASETNRNYYSGHGNWFPVMGQTVGTTSVAQWSKGEYAGATNTEDDLAIIAAGGAPLRSDDHPTAPAAPRNLGKQTSYSVAGVIETDADNDYFSFNRGCTGPMRIKATGIGQGAAVDLKLSVLKTDGTVIATNNPASSQSQVYPDAYYRSSGLDASVSFSKAANTTFRVKVEGVGYGNPLNTGYSGYGSIGQYRLTITSCTTSLTATKPGKPTIGTASSGTAGGAVNAVARWSAPSSTGGAAITGYRLQAVKVSSTGAVLRTYTFSSISASARSKTVGLPAGRYKFRVAASNRIGWGAYSAYSRIVTAR